LNTKQIQDKILSPDTYLIEYLVGDEYTFVWIVGKNSLKYEKLALTHDSLHTMIDSLRQPFRDVKTGRIRDLALVTFDLKLSHNLYEQIFQPIEKYVPEGSHIIIVPDDVLYYLPFEALVTEIEDKRTDTRTVHARFENAQYLIEKYSISYSPSASILDPELAKSKAKRGYEGKLLAFGNPDFGKYTGEGTIALSDTVSEITQLHLSSALRGPLTPLNQSEREVDKVAKIFKPALVYKRKEAKEEHLKKKSVSFPYIHISTHGFIEEKQPLYSSIIMAQDEDPSEDGFLQTYEIFNLDLDADLVTLSACETGLGQLSRGEGLIGLTRAFLYAGASSLLVSLWSVDESTSMMMEYFYKNIKKGHTKAEALRQAKLKMFKTRKNGISFSHPFLWAPFVLIGDYE